jgi:beta-xylosidase
MRNFLKTAAVTFGVVLTAGAAATAANAEGYWGYHHPRQEQVFDRLGRQDHRINREYREGEISRWDAMRLHREDSRIAREDRYFAHYHGGYITRREQRHLNREENRLSRHIGN